MPPRTAAVSMTGSSAWICFVLNRRGYRVRKLPMAQYAVAPSAENHGGYGDELSREARNDSSRMLSGYAFINRLRDRQSLRTRRSS